MQKTTGEMLDFLRSLGTPRLCGADDGTWYAMVKFPTPKGTSIEVSSDFNHPTHESALLQVIARLGTITEISSKIKSNGLVIG